MDTAILAMIRPAGSIHDQLTKGIKIPETLISAFLILVGYVVTG